MTLTEWFSLACILMLGAVSPGPSLALVIRNTSRSGPVTGLLTAIGHGAGVALYALATAFFLGALLHTHPQMLLVIKGVGIVCLLYFAWGALRSQGISGLESNTSGPRRNGLLDGFLFSFTNPKLMLFFVALFSPFLQEGFSVNDKLLITTTAGVIDGGWYALVVLLISQPLIFRQLVRAGKWLDRAMGIVLLVVAGRLLLL
ncbi:LysE family translocator [Plesiomonas shigelloides]|uniref:LysE family translocator n=1 Tax=Plesiomonas shigelloides TaxID=703 RepID=UPI001C5AA9E2|nr:LysE family translocator [Plesiomonas shigelloides]MBW3792445.1 LysE family translocator [Plesiomonas shigelloides]